MRPILAALGLILAAVLPAYGQNKVAVQLVPSVESVRAGDSFDIAVRFAMPLGWHMYWLNPGDSGLPPTITWSAPKGVTFGEPRFPVPERIQVPGGLTSYGFHYELVLIVPVTTSADQQDSLKLDATIKSFVCKDVCLLENAAASVTVPVGETKPRQDPRLAAWSAKLPKVATDEIKQAIEWSDDGKYGVLTIDYAKPPGGKCELFLPPASFAVFESTEIVVATNGDIRMRLPFRIIEKQNAPVAAPAIVAFTDSSTGKRSGVQFDVRFSFPR